jgi:signal transduction histidine kinase
VIGHDLKNPLSAVLMTAHVLQNRVADKDKPALDRIRRASQRMDRMIQDVVDFLHLRQGTALLLRFDGCDLGRLCRNAIDELARVQPGHQVVFENERPLPGTWDGERLEQLVFHVLSHGLMSGLAADGASLKLGSDVASEVTVTMHCRGRALSATEAAGLFDPLALEPGHVAASSSMGLYIARAIARAHGGDLMIAGPAEGGTEMTLRLPRTDLPASLAPG